MPSSPTLYHVLGVARDASQDDIRAAFRRLAKSHHPDKGGDVKEWMKVREAYNVLTTNRRDYDSSLDAANNSTRDYQSPESASASSILRSFFGNYVIPLPISVEDLRVLHNLSITDIYSNLNITVKFQRPIINLQTKQASSSSASVVVTPPTSGWVVSSSIRVSKAGVYGVFHGNTSGVSDLLVTLAMSKSDEMWHVSGRNLFVSHSLLLSDALTKKEITVKMPDNRLLCITLDDFVQPGKKVVVVGEGLPAQGGLRREASSAVRGDRPTPDVLRGDLVIVMNVILPSGEVSEEKRRTIASLLSSDASPTSPPSKEESLVAKVARRLSVMLQSIAPS